MEKMYFSLDDDFSFHSMDSVKLAKSGPMLNDCFFGDEGYDPIPLLKKQRNEDLIGTALFNNRENAVPSSESTWGLSEELNQYKNFEAQSDFERWADLKSITHEPEDWLEEWMDLNGIFDPSVEVPCVDIDVPICQSQESVDNSIEHQQDYVQSSVPEQTCIQEVLPSEFLQQPYWESDGFDSPPYVAPVHNEKFERCAAKKVTATRDYVLRPISKTVELEIPSAAIQTHRIRSPRVIKASFRSAQEHASITPKTARSSTYRTMTERKREQNRSAAIRYREKRREEANHKKEELRELELRNVALKTELSGLTAEIGYLKKLLNEVVGK